MKAMPLTTDSHNTGSNAKGSDIRRTLIEDFDNGFTELVREYQPGIYSGARRLTRGAQDAEDVAQDTFVRAYKALSTYAPERIADLRVRPWLWTIALNLCRNRARSQVTEFAFKEGDAGGTDDPEVFDDAAWAVRLASLSEAQRTAVVLRYVLDLSIAEIGEATERPVGTVKADISRALERLRLTMKAEVLHAR